MTLLQKVTRHVEFRPPPFDYLSDERLATPTFAKDKDMRFMMLVTLPAGHDYENGAMPSAELVAEMTKFNEEMVKAGVMLSGEGLHPTSKAARVETKDGKRVVTNGPFTETHEVLGGFWTIKVDSKEEAIEWAKRMPDKDAILVLRQIFEFEDFPEDVQEAADSEILREHAANSV